MVCSMYNMTILVEYKGDQLSFQVVEMSSFYLNLCVALFGSTFNFRSNMLPLTITIGPYEQSSGLSTFLDNIIVNLF